MSTSEQRARLRSEARSQRGVITLTQAREAGLGDEAVRHRVRSGQWCRVGVRVFQVAEHEQTPESRTIAAVLSLGDDATLIGRSAAWWWRLHGTAPALVEASVRLGLSDGARLMDRVSRRRGRRPRRPPGARR